MTSNQVLFETSTDDSWYGPATSSVQVHWSELSSSEANATMYRQSVPGSPMACRELEQYCWVGANGNHQCSALMGSSDALEDLILKMDSEDRDWIRWLLKETFIYAQPTKSPLDFLGTHTLRAREQLNGAILGSIPRDQWQTEVLHWHSTAMSYLQSLFTATVIGYTDPKLQHLIVFPNNTDEKKMCENQV